MSEFPRGWVLSDFQYNGAAAAMVSAPAIPGISHVLTSLSARMVNIGPSAVGAAPAVFVGTSLATVIQWQLLVPPAYSTDEWDWSGELATPVNSVLNVYFQIAYVNISEQVVAQGYDI